MNTWIEKLKKIPHSSPGDEKMDINSVEIWTNDIIPELMSLVYFH